VVALDSHRPDDVPIYVERRQGASDVFWPVPATREEIEVWLSGAELMRPSLIMAIRVAGDLVGGVEARVLTPTIGTLDYWVFPEYRSRGFGGRAVALARDGLKSRCGVDIVQLRIRKGNVPSIAIAKRLGFRAVEQDSDEILFYG
jgi:RimJ/RimL family protein N-acetyltransferase